MHEETQDSNYKRLSKALKNGQYDLLPDGAVVDDANGRMVCGRLNSGGVVEISYSSTPAVYLGRQISLHRLLRVWSLPVEVHGAERAVDGLRRQRCDIGNLIARLSGVVSGRAGEVG